jgi:3-deoxy-7-phosphoheptulonate synthase
MIILMRHNATRQQIDHVLQRVQEMGLRPMLSEGTERKLVHVIGDTRDVHREAIAAAPGVDRVIPILAPYKIASREVRPEPTVLPLGRSSLGGKKIAVIAGPCAVEGREMLLDIARSIKASGAVALRGGAFKPRTNPYSFKGLMEDGLKYLAEAREETGLAVVTEVLSEGLVDLVERYADVLQIGARNMQNFALLSATGQTRKPVLLKRGMAATLDELLLAAEYILAEGNSQVILCERGIRTFEQFSRATLSLAAVPELKLRTHLPVIVDPSHATGARHLVPPMCRAAIAAGADGLLIEVHPVPEQALVDGDQSVDYGEFDQIMHELGPIAAAVGREM